MKPHWNVAGIRNELHKWKGAVFIILFLWIIFDLAVYATYSERWLPSNGTGTSQFTCTASGAYLVALFVAIYYNYRKVFGGHCSLWISLGIVSLAFGTAGYIIEQSVYLNANDPEKSEGVIIFAVALIVGLVTALICSASALGKRLLDTYSDKGPQK